MSNTVIPAGVKLAAKRAFIRTFTQSLATAIPIAAVTIPTTGDALLGIGLAAGSAVAGALLAGTASALSIISNGVPADYIPAALDKATGREGY